MARHKTKSRSREASGRRRSVRSLSSASRRPSRPRQMHEVRPGLFIGSLRAAEDRRLLAAAGITHILTMNGDRPCFPNSFRYEVKRTKNEDRALLLEYIPKNIDFIRRALEEEGPRGKVLVHCTRGINRSGSMVVAYLMWREGLSYERALQEARRARPQIEPRAGMIDQLRVWEHILRYPDGLSSKPNPSIASLVAPKRVVAACMLPLLASVSSHQCSLTDVLPRILRHGKLLQFSRTAFQAALETVTRGNGEAAEQARRFPDCYLHAMAARQREKGHLTPEEGQHLADKREHEWLHSLAAQCRLWGTGGGRRCPSGLTARRPLGRSLFLPARPWPCTPPVTDDLPVPPQGHLTEGTPGRLTRSPADPPSAHPRSFSPSVSASFSVPNAVHYLPCAPRQIPTP
eukprot:TRINITY_DN2465_c0_g1_i1.p1 TRINITY_DN2465_c0_g1~~TRINITY_DN2465_c0_g1_i1.p1  ORF type:complete len:403 (+),score=70.84 TRINITY_DN2465_c0_g1_i1:81-1289(+)